MKLPVDIVDFALVGFDAFDVDFSVIFFVGVDFVAFALVVVVAAVAVVLWVAFLVVVASAEVVFLAVVVLVEVVCVVVMAVVESRSEKDFKNNVMNHTFVTRILKGLEI